MPVTEMRLCLDCRVPLPDLNKSRGTRCACGLTYPHDLILRYTPHQWNLLPTDQLGDSLMIRLPDWLERHLRTVS